MQMPHAEPWPFWMTDKTAAKFTDERSVRAFLRACGRLYPRPIKVPGKGKRWLKSDLEAAMSRLAGRRVDIDVSDLL